MSTLYILTVTDDGVPEIDEEADDDDVLVDFPLKVRQKLRRLVFGVVDVVVDDGIDDEDDVVSSIIEYGRPPTDEADDTLPTIQLNISNYQEKGGRCCYMKGYPLW